MQEIIDVIQKIYQDENLIEAVMSNVKKGIEKTFLKVTVKPVEIKGVLQYQFTFHYDKKVIHENYSEEEAVERAIELMTGYFKQGFFHTVNYDFQILVSKKGKSKVLRKQPTKFLLSTSHDRKKNYKLEEGKPCDFLIRLGISDEQGRVFKKKYDKFRQINRYLDFIEDCVPHLKRDKRIRIVDFGCGKAYLTFALYYYLVNEKKMNVEIVGLDLKEDVIDYCNKVANELAYDDLKFIVGDIKGFNEFDYVDMVISLHACDTATDESLSKAVNWDADVILAVPCCQNELLNKIHNDNLRIMEKHGIVKEKLATLVTDSLRACVLEVMGYNAKIFEFIDLEHTPKNQIIKAVKAKNANLKAADEYNQFKTFWQMEPYIETCMGETFRNKVNR